jgi:hypothetical protein
MLKKEPEREKGLVVKRTEINNVVDLVVAERMLFFIRLQ